MTPQRNPAPSVLRPSIPDLPPRFRKLPLNHQGYPIPWFVHIDDDGNPDFRVIGRNKVPDAHKKQLCWLCGEKLGSYKAFVIGPMCAINRISGEPPSHKDCAIFAAVACPFLTRPGAKRRETGLPEDGFNNPGAIDRNPGVAMVWITRSYKVLHVRQAESYYALFTIGDPEAIEYYAEGRPAIREEIMASITSGLPILEADAQKEGPAAVAELRRLTEQAYALVPA